MYKVLIVDDEKKIRDGIKQLIDWNSLGFEATDAAGNGNDALDILRNSHFDLVLTDVKMPIMDGLELSKAIQAEGLNSKVIIMSAYNDFEYARSAIEYGVSNYILKPLNEEDITCILIKIKKKLDYEYFTLNASKTKQIIRTLLFEHFMSQTVENAYIASSSLGLKLNNPAYCCAIIKPHSNTKLEMCALVSNLEHLLLDNSWGYCVEEHNRILLLLLPHEGKVEDLDTITQSIKTMVEQYCNNNFYIALGKMVYDYKSIGLSYNYAKNMTFMGNTNIEGNILSYKDLLTSMLHKNNEAFTIERLLKALKTYDKYEIEMQISLIKENVENNYLAPSTYYTLATIILTNVCELFEGYNFESLIEKMYSYSNLEDAHQFLKNVCLSLCESSLNNSNNSKIINLIKDYIDSYYDKEINIKSISKHFNYNTSYIGRVFNQHEGMSIKDYIMRCRIDKASKMLLQGDIKIADIAHLTGFNDTNRFYAAFKALKGCTPRNYNK